MSKVGVIVALAVAVALAALALLLGGRGVPQADRGGPFLDFDPARVVEIRVTKNDGSFDAVRRGQDPGAWSVISGGPDGKETEPWPAGATQVRSVLRILSTLSPERPAEAGATMDGQARTVKLVLDDQQSRELQLSPRALGGLVLAKTGTRSGWVGSEVGKMLAVSGPRDWRDPSALPGLGLDIARITLKGQGGAVVLARVQGRWGVREPVAEPAEPAAVVKLLSALQTVRVTDFLDAGTPEGTGLESPIAELSVESDSREGEGAQARVVTTRTSLAAGQAAEMGAKTVFARLSRSRGGITEYSRVVIVSGEVLAAITTDPASYFSRRALSAPEADVGGLVISPQAAAARTYRRTIDGWEADSSGVPATVSRADSEAIAALLGVVSQTPTDQVIYSESWPPALGPQAESRAVAAVEIHGAGGAPMATFGVSAAVLSANGAREQMIIRSGQVWRVYAAEPSAAVLIWLARQP